VTTKIYISTMTAILGGIMFSPAFDTLVQVYVISVVVFVSTVVNFLFRIQKIREYIVKRITQDVLAEIMKDSDVRRIIAEKIFAGEKPKDL